MTSGNCVTESAYPQNLIEFRVFDHIDVGRGEVNCTEDTEQANVVASVVV
jgi:hypothetical protein